jgi:hypothetical protein
MSRLDRPLSRLTCVVGWLAATVVFIVIVQELNGPTVNDAPESIVSAWSIAHGQLACAFPANHDLAAPLYPFVSGGLVAIFRLGHAHPFPPPAALGVGCSKAYYTVGLWGFASKALVKTLWIGYLCWIALVAGVVALLRASGRGRRLWEPATLLLIACLPPVWMCMQTYFHPQDLLAIGLALGALACVQMGAWVWAGVLLGLGVLTQQFVLLVAAPLVVVAPAARRWPYTIATTATVGLAAVLIYASASTNALKTLLLGSGTSFGGLGGTWLTMLSTNGTHVAILVSRVVPLELSLVLAWWALRRLGGAILQPVALVSLVTVSLSLRLVFEQNLYGYYFAALAVMLVLLDVLRGHIRATLVAWLVAVSVVFFVGETTAQQSWHHSWPISEQLVVPVVTAVTLLAVGLHALWKGPRRRDLVWIGLVVALAFAWNRNPASSHLSLVWWQCALVGLGLALAAGPLLGVVGGTDPDNDPRTETAHGDVGAETRATT